MKKMDKFDIALARLHEGSITFAQFYEVTKNDWKKMSSSLFGCWKIPLGVEVEDVEQEMLTEAWRAATLPTELGGFDPKRGISLRAYVVWNAHAKAKKWIHTQRKAKRRDDNAPSRHAFCVSQMLDNYSGESEMAHEDLIDLYKRTRQTQEESIDAKNIFLLLKSVGTDIKSRAALQAWIDASGNIQEAASDWFEDPTTEVIYNVKSLQQAETLIRNEVEKVFDFFGVKRNYRQEWKEGA